MLTDLRKLPAMHFVHGVDPQKRKCKECCNFRRFEYHGKRYFKCAAYGISQSEATDWGANYLACGMFNISLEYQTPLFETFKRNGKNAPPIIVAGQIRMEV